MVVGRERQSSSGWEVVLWVTDGHGVPWHQVFQSEWPTEHSAHSFQVHAHICGRIVEKGPLWGWRQCFFLLLKATFRFKISSNMNVGSSWVTAGWNLLLIVESCFFLKYILSIELLLMGLQFFSVALAQFSDQNWNSPNCSFKLHIIQTIMHHNFASYKRFSLSWTNSKWYIHATDWVQLSAVFFFYMISCSCHVGQYAGSLLNSPTP